MFDKKELVESVIERRLKLQEIVSEARAEILRIESCAIRPVGSSDYAGFLRILVFFLISEVKVRPANLSDDKPRPPRLSSTLPKQPNRHPSIDGCCQG